MVAERPRVLMILTRYPQHSETYIKTEIESLWDAYDIRIVSLGKPDRTYTPHRPHERIERSSAGETTEWVRTKLDSLVRTGKERINELVGERLRIAEWFDDENIGPYHPRLLEIIAEFRPHVMHTHYLHNVPLLGSLARQTNVPWTVRGHSYCVMDRSYRNELGGHMEPSRCTRVAAPSVNDELCLGALTFPFTQPALEKAGIRPEKIIPCPAVIDYAMFHDESPNGEGIVCAEPALPKKRMCDIVDLAELVPDPPIDAYAIGYEIEKLRRYAAKKGSRVSIHEPVPHEQMTAIFKHHRWLVYTSDRRTGNCGWPVAVSEAQAAGLGVCVANVHPHSADQLGGAGFVYDSLAELADIVSQPYPEEMRQHGFEHARGSDIRTHRHLLTDLWAGR